MERSGALATELDVYAAQKDALLAEHEGQFVLIHDHEVVGTYVAEEDALAEGYNRFGNVPFLVKRVDRVETPVNYGCGRPALYKRCRETSPTFHHLRDHAHPDGQAALV